jgi:arabinose-5-phosphate isomerase
MYMFDFDYARNVIECEAKAIESLTRVIDGEFSRAVEAIFNSTGNIIVSGMGKAGIIGTKISATLASTGTPSHFLHPAEAIHGDLGRVRQDDIVLALSHSGESEEIVRLIDSIKRRDIKLIAITGNAKSSLAKYSDIVICMGMLEEAGPLGIAPSVSTTCMLALGDSLAFTIMKARKFSSEDYARFHPGGAIGASLITVEQSMMFKKGEKLPLAKVSDTVGDMFEKQAGLKRRGAVMVVLDDGKLAGIITDADLRRAVVDKKTDLFETKVAEIMTSDCKRVMGDTLAAEAMAIFHKFRIDDLPVVDENDLPVGLIDVQDVVSLKVVS